jgi:hypothetical protein
MRLYHFTSWSALIGEGRLAGLPLGKIDLRTVAAPGSIIADGLKPCKVSSYDPVLRSPLPPCVWLTSDPDMGLKTHMGNHFSSYIDLRVTVLIPSTDRRLVHRLKYFRKHGRYALSETAQRITATFYVYFGNVTRIAGVTSTDHTEEVVT